MRKLKKILERVGRGAASLSLVGFSITGCMRPVYDSRGDVVREEVDWGKTAAVAGFGLIGAGLARDAPKAVAMGNRIADYGVASAGASNVQQNVNVYNTNPQQNILAENRDNSLMKEMMHSPCDFLNYLGIDANNQEVAAKMRELEDFVGVWKGDSKVFIPAQNQKITAHGTVESFLSCGNSVLISKGEIYNSNTSMNWLNMLTWDYNKGIYKEWSFDNEGVFCESTTTFNRNEKKLYSDYLCSDGSNGNGSSRFLDGIIEDRSKWNNNGTTIIVQSTLNRE